MSSPRAAVLCPTFSDGNRGSPGSGEESPSPWAAPCVSLASQALWPRSARFSGRLHIRSPPMIVLADAESLLVAGGGLVRVPCSGAPCSGVVCSDMIFLRGLPWRRRYPPDAIRNELHPLSGHRFALGSVSPTWPSAVPPPHARGRAAPQVPFAPGVAMTCGQNPRLTPAGRERGAEPVPGLASCNTHLTGSFADGGPPGPIELPGSCPGIRTAWAAWAGGPCRDAALRAAVLAGLALRLLARDRDWPW